MWEHGSVLLPRSAICLPRRDAAAAGRGGDYMSCHGARQGLPLAGSEHPVAALSAEIERRCAVIAEYRRLIETEEAIVARLVKEGKERTTKPAGATAVKETRET